MKVLFLNSSHQGQKEFTNTLINLMAKVVKKANADYEIITLAEKKINKCNACAISKIKHFFQCVILPD